MYKTPAMNDSPRKCEAIRSRYTSHLSSVLRLAGPSTQERVRILKVRPLDTSMTDRHMIIRVRCACSSNDVQHDASVLHNALQDCATCTTNNDALITSCHCLLTTT
ncbi:hypothetical protein E2C01_030549 [Portunus trituberculatus]|uniref:Uncharacterized protein n=1 Tax=Portunus trituberculatus TaxID=210409 RepID=A0A5B7EV51_PORTR|nr:hypothetical protein [Portunus trituberculatus]